MAAYRGAIPCRLAMLAPVLIDGPAEGCWLLPSNCRVQARSQAASPPEPFKPQTARHIVIGIELYKPRCSLRCCVLKLNVYGRT